MQKPAPPVANQNETEGGGFLLDTTPKPDLLAVLPEGELRGPGISRGSLIDVLPKYHSFR